MFSLLAKWRDDVPATTKNQTSYQASPLPRLPYELIEKILIYFMLDPPIHAACGRFRTLSLVNHQFLVHAKHLRLISLSFSFTQHYFNDSRSRQNWKTISEWDLTQGSDKSAPCQALRSFGGAWDAVDCIFTKVLKIVSPSVRYLELRGGTHADLLVGIPSSQKMLYSFPRLSELMLYDIYYISAHSMVVKLRELMSIPLLDLHVHHVFEPHMERHLLSLSADIISNSTLGIGHPIFLNSDDIQARRLDVFIDRRSDLGMFIDLVLQHGIRDRYSSLKKGSDGMELGLRSLNIWLKDAEDMPKEVDDIIRREHWIQYIKWDVHPPSSSQLLSVKAWCEAKRCSKLYVCRCKSTAEEKPSQI